MGKVSGFSRRAQCGVARTEWDMNGMGLGSYRADERTRIGVVLRRWSKERDVAGEEGCVPHCARRHCVTVAEYN